MRTTFPQDQLAKAIAGARSWRQVNTRLGRVPEADTKNLKALAAEYEIGIEHLLGANRRTYTDAELRAAVRSSTTWAEVAEKLGKNPRSGAARKVMRAGADRINLDVSHLKSGRQPKAEPSGRDGI